MLNLETIREFFISQPVVRAWLFGSYARGEETPSSDIDILVEFDKKERVGLFRHADMMVRLEERLRKKVDLVPINALYPALKKNILTDRILIYERQ